MFRINTAKQNDISKINQILDEVFGSDRYGKVVYLLRDGIDPLAELSFVVRVKAVVIASLQFWPVVVKDDEVSYDALLLGPIAVGGGYRGQGIGLELMDHGILKAKKLGHSRVILVGDEAYYHKAGFSRDLAEGLDMPGLLDQHRLLARELVPDSLKNVKGLISRIK